MSHRQTTAAFAAFRMVSALALALLLLFASGCASTESVAEQEAARSNAWLLTRVVVPRDVQAEELRLRDVDTETLHSANAQPEPILMRVKAGRYRFRTLKAVIPGSEAPKFEQPERALEIHACCVNYIGDVVIKSRREGYRLVIEPRPGTVLEAMQMTPEVFEKRPVHLVLGDQKRRRLRFEGLKGIHGAPTKAPPPEK